MDMDNALNRTERKKEDTRQKIIKIAMDLFSRQGVDAVTMEHIAEAADIARGTLYNHFPVKEAIISEYIQQISIALNTERIERVRGLPDTRARMTFALRELMAGVRARQDIFEKYFVYRVQQMISLRRDAVGEKGLRSLETAIIQMGQESGEIRTDIPLPILEALFEFVFIEVAQQFYQDPVNFRAEETISTCVEMFINGAVRN
jgi:AcrR family transcriptional regulator